jgi:Glycosyltransferase family 87
MTIQPYVRPLAIGATLLSFFLCLCGVLVTARDALQGRVDFRHLYTAGYMARTGHGKELHDFDAAEKFQNAVVGPAVGALPFNHLAYESLIYAPFSLLPYRAAYIAFFVANLSILAFAFLTLRPYLDPLREVWIFLPMATFICFLPVTLALTEGQDSIILLALMICANRAFDRGEGLAAGSFVGLTLFKFQYGLPIALLFLVWRRWRFLAGFAAAAAVVIAISLWLTGWDGFLTYFHSLTEMSSRFSPAFGARYGIRPGLMPNLRGLVQTVGYGATPLTKVITALSSLLVLIWTATRRPSLPLALIAAILVSYHHLITDTAMMILPASLALVAALSADAKSKNPTRVAALAATVLFAPAPLLLAGVRFYLLAIPMLALVVAWDGGYPHAVERLHAKI